VGVDIIIRPEWQALFAELESVYTDKATFVPAVVSCVHAWSQALTSLLDDEDNQEWTDELLERAEGSIRASLEVGTPIFRSSSQMIMCPWNNQD
jgi:hypothetical protein